MHYFFRKAALLVLGAIVMTLVGFSPSCQALASEVAPEEVIHPLDPLTASELKSAVKVLKESGHLGKQVSLVTLVVAEPGKDEVANFKPGDAIPRKAMAVLYHIDTNQTHEVVTDLTSRKVVSDKLCSGEQPMQLEEDTPLGADILAKTPEWVRGMARRGIKELKNVHLEMFVVGNPVNINNPKRDRLLRAYPYYREIGENSFGQPIEGLSAIVNLTTKQAAVHDNKDVIPLAGLGANYFDPKQVGPLRSQTRPMECIQPDGLPFEIKGHEIAWQKWRFRYEICPREGLVLHTINYDDDGKVRSVLNRANISEVSVPYGAPGLDWVWRSPLDEGEYGLGRLTTTLRKGHEVPALATTIDVPYANSVGDVANKEAAVAIWEQDGGILWEHHDDDGNRTSTRRSRQLCIAHMFTLGNYDYFTQWIFNQDGSIDVKVTLNGDVLAQGVNQTSCEACNQQPDEEGRLVARGVERYGTLLAPNIVGINHQHFFCFRLDFDVDGRKNSLYELNVRPLNENRGHLEQNTFTLERTLLRRANDARRDLSDVTARCWKIFNPNSRSNLGHFAGYVVEPGANAYPYSHPNSYNRKRAGFLDHHFWATRYSPQQMFAAGDYPTSSVGAQGLPEWSDESSIENEDVVAWYTVGVTHVPRVEDWPVMPSTTMGFRILPDGFFKRNPALDIPEPASK